MPDLAVGADIPNVAFSRAARSGGGTRMRARSNSFTIESPSDQVSSCIARHCDPWPHTAKEHRRIHLSIFS
jgi:hypothetical protein